MAKEKNVLYRLPTTAEIMKMGRFQLYRLIDVLGIEEVVTSGYEEGDVELNEIEEIDHLRYATSDAIRIGTSLCKHRGLPQPERQKEGTSNYHREISYAGCTMYSYGCLWNMTDDELNDIIGKYDIAGECNDRSHLGMVCNIAEYMGTTDKWGLFKRTLNSRFKCYNGKGVKPHDVLWVLFRKEEGSPAKNRADELGVVEEHIAYYHTNLGCMVVELNYNGIQVPLPLNTNGVRILHTGRTAKGYRPYSIDEDRECNDCDEPFDEKRYRMRRK
jgi:hypothetical protein